SRAMSASSSKQFNTAPARSLDQRMDALGRANEVRSRRAALKADLKHGRVSISEILGDPPEYLLTAKVIDLLMAAPKCGRVKSARIMEQCRISPSKTVGGLSERQRHELLATFGG
ncbi:MAG TPA: integration host factor, actinobacterial type, partial [Thermoleophilia bacterium]|nr:integration host factor, actinobacterial type [Thermoleophilia bacterium]